MASSDPTDTPGPWAVWLRSALNASGKRAVDLKNAGITNEPSVSKWLRGEGRPLDAETVIAVAHFLGEPNAIAALEASGRHMLADTIRSQIRHAYEDQALVRIRTHPGLSKTDMEAIEQNYLRRQADAVAMMELEIAQAEGEKTGDRAPGGAGGGGGPRDAARA